MKFFRYFFWWPLPEIGQICDADCIISHGGTMAKSGGVGVMNVALAKLIEDLPDLPLIVQGEVSPALTPHRQSRVLAASPTQAASAKEKADWLASIDRPVAEYIESFDIALWHRQVMREYGLKRPILVSYAPHVSRAYWLSKKVGISPITLSKYPVVYEPDPYQWWVKSPWFNNPREFLARVREVLYGRI